MSPLNLRAVTEVLEDAYMDNIEDAIYGGLKPPPRWSERRPWIRDRRRMRDAWPPIVLFPRVARIEALWRRARRITPSRLRSAVKVALVEGREEWRYG